MLEWADSDAEHEALHAKVATVLGHGYEAHWVDRAEALRLEPDMDPGALPADEIVFFPREGWIAPTRLIAYLLSTLDPPPGMHSISLDNVRAGRLMAAHLARCGRSSIGLVVSGRRPSQLGRVAGLRSGLTGLDLPLPEEAVAVAENETAVGAAIGSRLGRARDRHEPLDAVVCATGWLTTAAHPALTARGLAIPGDIAFLAMDDFAWASALGITVIAQPSYEMGRRAAELVVEHPGEPVRPVFEPTLIACTSCGERPAN